MKIVQPPIKGPISQPSTSRTTASNKGGTAGAGATSNTVALSSTARHLSALSNSDNDVNLAKVAEIRQALKDGTLVINPERIADGLIQSAKELVGK